ncbi:MAG: hypothetical protein CL992_03025 [Euryarchaeota archaeon]|nr:hypothetical protein [Euryarchaeota archaeon]
MPTVVIADEKQGRRNLLASTLTRHGFTTSRAQTLGQAEKSSLVAKPDVLLIDEEWSNGEVHETISNLRNSSEFNGRVIMLVSKDDPDTLAAAAQAGVTEVVVKPFHIELLIQALHRQARKEYTPPLAAGIRHAGDRPIEFDPADLDIDESVWTLPIIRRILQRGQVDHDLEYMLEQAKKNGLLEEDEGDVEKVSQWTDIVLDSLTVGTLYRATQAKASVEKAEEGEEEDKRRVVRIIMDDDEKVEEEEEEEEFVEAMSRLDEELSLELKRLDIEAVSILEILDESIPRVELTAERKFIKLDAEALRAAHSAMDLIAQILLSAHDTATEIPVRSFIAEAGHVLDELNELISIDSRSGQFFHGEDE